MYEVKRFIIGFPFPEVYAVRGDKGWVIFDSGTLGTKEKLTALFQGAGVDLSKVVLNVVTHSHTDHYANTAIMQEITGAPVLCHSSAAPVMAAGGNMPIIPVNVQGETLLKNDAKVAESVGVNPFGIPLPVRADITFEDSFDLRPYGLDGTLYHTPGHTDCSTCAILKTGQAFCGDTFVSFDGYPWFGVFSVNRQLHELSGGKILYESKILYMGHGGAVDVSAFAGVRYSERAEKQSEDLLPACAVLMPDFLPLK